MARFSAQDVLDRVWNDSGDEGSISDSDYARGNSNSDSESDEWSGDSAESSESSDTESGNESEESDNEPAARNNLNPRGRRGQPHQNQPALQWTPANMERPRAFPFTGNSGIQVRTVGFGPIDYFLLDKGYHLYIDNWYTSIPLLKFLFNHSTLACGTIRSNRKGFPDPVKKA